MAVGSPRAEDLRGRPRDELPVDGVAILSIGREQSAIGDHVDEARDTPRPTIECVHCRLREHVPRGAGHAHPVANVCGGIVGPERLEMIATRDPLRDLPHVGPVEQFA